MATRELTDYSGEFIPDFRHDLLTRETLAGLVRLHGRFRVVLDGSWYLVVKEVAGDEMAFACDQKVWDGLTAYLIRQITDSMNIKRKGLADLMKYFQITGGPWTWEPELLGEGLGRLTVNHCPTLDNLEKEGEGRENSICRVLEPTLLQKIAGLFDRRIRVNALILPPRRSEDDLPCQWEFVLEGKGEEGAGSTARGEGADISSKAAGLVDYSGAFIPGTRLEDFSKETLIAEIGAYSQIIHRVDGTWYMVIKEALGNEAALSCDKKVWSRLAGHEVEMVANYLNFRESTVSSVLKFFQTHFFLQNMEQEIELKGPDRGLITTRYCHSLAALEGEGEGREAEICNQMCTMNYQHFADFFNPTIKAVPIAIPPLKGPDGIACQWEFKLDA